MAASAFVRACVATAPLEAPVAMPCAASTVTVKSVLKASRFCLTIGPNPRCLSCASNIGTHIALAAPGVTQNSSGANQISPRRSRATAIGAASSTR